MSLHEQFDPSAQPHTTPEAECRAMLCAGLLPSLRPLHGDIDRADGNIKFYQKSVNNFKYEDISCFTLLNDSEAYVRAGCNFRGER
jgi:hypothetical protein